MDCCNYMHYNSQTYYGSQYYETVPPGYHDEFYAQQVYHEYYGPSYYPQQWSPISSVADYVYNPKEARIRKAMREATRDRSIGASPMLPRPSARLPSHEWNQSHEKHLMMAPLGGMRGSSLESAVCNFPISGSGSGQFMPSMSAYCKLDSPMPPNASVHTNYMQTNPLIQLQQQTEMWHSMQENVPQRSPGDNYMLPGVSSFHGHVSSPELPTNLMVEKPRTPVRPMSASNPPGTPPHANGNVSPVDVLPSESKVNEIQFESKSPEQNQVGAAVENTASSASTEPYLTSYQSPPEASQFNKEECSHAKKSAVLHHRCGVSVNRKTPNKTLPDFNQAFGSTERGRFQSPPDPRLVLNKEYLDYFSDSTSVKYESYPI